MTSIPAIEPINVQTTGVHHVAIRSTDIARSRLFYLEQLGFTLLLETPEMFIFAAGGTAFAVRAPDARTQGGDTFDPFRVGLDHIALACTDAQELRRVTDGLCAAGIENTGVKTDPTLGKEYVAFKDPDGIKWELYMA
ncbi:MAG: VOC family protein [Gemmatimonadota bacterium]